MKLKDRIRQKRLEKGYTLEQLAESIGVRKQTIYKYESGVISNIPWDKIEALAAVLDTTPSYLLGLDPVTDSPKWPKGFGIRIRSRRRDLGLTQSQLAERIGCADKSSISKIEKGINDIPLSKVRDFAVALDTTPSYLLGLSSDQTEQRRYDGRIRIGDEVWVHGYVDEIRRDVVIIRNTGGYFGTVPEEIARGERRHEEEDTVAEGDA